MFSEFHDPLGVQFVGKQSVILYVGLISGLKRKKKKITDLRFKIRFWGFLQVWLLPRDIWSLWVYLTFLSRLLVGISIFLWRHNLEFVFWHPWRVVHPDCNQSWTIYKERLNFSIQSPEQFSKFFKVQFQSILQSYFFEFWKNYFYYFYRFSGTNSPILIDLEKAFFIDFRKRFYFWIWSNF